MLFLGLLATDVAIHAVTARDGVLEPTERGGYTIDLTDPSLDLDALGVSTPDGEVPVAELLGAAQAIGAAGGTMEIGWDDDFGVLVGVGEPVERQAGPLCPVYQETCFTFVWRVCEFVYRGNRPSDDGECPDPVTVVLF